MALSNHREHLRSRNILREVLGRIHRTQDWFTIPEVACGVDAGLLSNVVPECARRAVHKLVTAGYLAKSSKQYRLCSNYARVRLAGIYGRNHHGDRQLDVLLSTQMPFPCLGEPHDA